MPDNAVSRPVSTRASFFFALFVFLLAAAPVMSGCAGSAGRSAPSPSDQGTIVSTGARRADPGYIQYLERLSMAGSQVELARVVSGSQLAWLRPAATPFPDPLLALADTWLAVNPLATLPETKRSVFSSFRSPVYWQILGKSKLNGVYFAPSSGSGSLWAYNRKASISGEDVIQYTFSETAGTEDEYFRLLDMANNNRKLLGLDLTPATTGLGPDFFLAARYHRQFAGIYCMVELPKKVWSALPVVSDQWRGEPLDDAQTALLASQNLLPPAMAQDFMPTGKNGGWAVTGEIHGVDGLMRRWAYRYYGSADQPVLNWEDPSTGARRILSGSAIRSVGIHGSALVGLKLDGLYGLDSSLPGSPTRFTPSPADEAAFAISREVRRYGGWGWLKDEIPFSLTRNLMAEGPDFFQDTIFSPGLEHALLTGSTRLLDAMVDDAIIFGLDMRRFVHATTGEQGVSYMLPHLAEVASGNTEATILTPKAAHELRQDTQKEIMQVVYAATFHSPRGDDKAPLHKERLHTTPAGIAALALGAGNAHSVVPDMEPLVRDGHFLQVFIRAMLPGLFMISGQDMAGTLPLSWYSMTDSAEEWDIAQASRSAMAYTQSVPESAVTSLGVPRARTLYSTPDIQLLEDDSFIARLSEALAIRASYGVSGGALHGRFITTAPGCFAFAVMLPSSGQPASARFSAPDAAPQETQVQIPAYNATADEAMMGASAASRTPSATERLKRRYQEDLALRDTLEQRIITAPDAGQSRRGGDAAIIVVVNFSRETIRQVLNLHKDPLLKEIRRKGDPVLLTRDHTGKGGIAMSNGEQTITLNLGPWRCAAVLIGKP